jgi:hypothetical protein
MRIRKSWLVLTLGLLAVLFAVQAQAQNNEIEGDVGYYFPGDITLPNARLNYQAGVSYGARYGHRFAPLFGGDISWSHFEADNNRSEADRLQCEKCDLTFDFVDFSLDWYPGGSDWAVYAGIGWLTYSYKIITPVFDISQSKDNFTWHIGTAYTWKVGPSFYIRPDARLRFLTLNQKASGKYSSEDAEFRVGFGWRF